MSIKTGDAAPDFTLSSKTAEGPVQATLSSHAGKENVLLLFFPMAFTGVCTQEFCDISNGLNAYTTLNAKVYGVSGDNPFAQEAWAAKEGIKVQLLSDYDHAVARSYGVAYDSFLPEIGLGMGGVPKRSAFLIDKAGVVRYAEVKEDARELPDFSKILDTLKTLG
jgi:peroxiredoxin